MAIYVPPYFHRYQFFLQLRNDIQTGKNFYKWSQLIRPFHFYIKVVWIAPGNRWLSWQLWHCNVCATLGISAHFGILAEFGDFNPKEHSANFVSEFRFHPSQDEQMERDILHHFGTKCAGLSPSQAELVFLNRARLLDFYGVDMVNLRTILKDLISPLYSQTLSYTSKYAKENQ